MQRNFHFYYIYIDKFVYLLNLLPRDYARVVMVSFI